MKYTSSIEDCIAALDRGDAVYAKNRMGDWIKVGIILPNGDAIVADDLSGFNSGIIGQRMTLDNPKIDLCIRDYEIQ